MSTQILRSARLQGPQGGVVSRQLGRLQLKGVASIRMRSRGPRRSLQNPTRGRRHRQPVLPQTSSPPSPGSRVNLEATTPAGLAWKQTADKGQMPRLGRDRIRSGGMSRPCRWRCRQAWPRRIWGSGGSQATRKSWTASSYRSPTRPGRASSAREPGPRPLPRRTTSPRPQVSRLCLGVGRPGNSLSRLRASMHRVRGKEASRSPSTTLGPRTIARSWTSPVKSHGSVANPPRSLAPTSNRP